MIGLIRYALWKRGVAEEEIKLLLQISTHIVAAIRELVNADENGRWNYDFHSLTTYGVSATHKTEGKIYETRFQATKIHLERACATEDLCLKKGIPQYIIEHCTGGLKKNHDPTRELWGKHVAAQFAG